MNAIEEAIAIIAEWQDRDPETSLLDGHNMTGDQAWRSCLHKVQRMLEQVRSKHCVADISRSLCELCDGLGGYAIVGSSGPGKVCPGCKGTGFNSSSM